MSVFAPIKSGFTTHRYPIGAAAGVLLVFVWMVTCGTYALFDWEHFGQFYDAQAASLLAGHWDVPAQAIFPEAYVHDGKFYGYYGFVPALPRMALNRLFPGMTGCWSRLSMTAACAATLLYCYLLLLRARRWMDAPPKIPLAAHRAHGGFLLLAGLGSTTIFLGSRAFIYHEAIIWATTFALAAYYHLLAYLMDARWRHLAAACAAAYLSFFCRITTGCGPILAILIVALSGRAGLTLHFCRVVVLAHLRFSRNDDGGRVRPPYGIVPAQPLRVVVPHVGGACSGPEWTGTSEQSIRPPVTRPPLIHCALAGAALLAILITFIAVNHAKFGTLLQPAPIQYYSQMIRDPQRLAHSGGRWMRIGNVPTDLYAYVSPGSIVFEPTFPWVFPQENLRTFPGCRMDTNGPFSSITAGMPVLFVLAMVGVATMASGLGRRRQPPPPNSSSARDGAAMLVLIGSLGGIAPVLLFFNVDLRYLHEFFPALAFAGAFGLHRLLAIRRAGLRSVIALALILGGTFEIYANTSFGLVYQRLLVFDRLQGPDAEMRSWQRSIDQLFTR
jgi:hypothetical protein